MLLQLSLCVLLTAVSAYYPQPSAHIPAEFIQQRPFIAPLANNPSVHSYGYGFLGPQNRDYRGHLDLIGTRGTFGWGTYRPTYYDAIDKKVHPWTSQYTGIIPWADHFNGAGLENNLAFNAAYADDDGDVETPHELLTNSVVNPLGADPVLPGGENPLKAGANPLGPYGIGSLNLGSPVGLSYMGTGAGTGVGWIKKTAGHPLPYVGYGPQGLGGIGAGIPLTEHPIFRTLPGLYHPPASNVFF